MCLLNCFNVYEDTIIDAHTLKIDGITHKDSTQYTKTATIYTHQGVLRCHEANITLLDDGEVHATDVIIDTMIGGSIYAQNVTIKHLKPVCLSFSSAFLILVFSLTKIFFIFYQSLGFINLFDLTCKCVGIFMLFNLINSKFSFICR